MKIHEYQAKEILSKYNVPVQDGITIEQEADIERAIDEVAQKYETKQFVIKAQVHAGGRGKGGGVKFSSDKAKAIENSKAILGMNLITPQTGEGGQLVRKIMIGEAIDIDKEYYLAITLDRRLEMDVIMASTEGGMDIEEVAHTHPEKIIKEWINPAVGMRVFQARRIAKALGFDDVLLKEAIKLISDLYRCYLESDASIVEINPLVLTGQGKLLALDAKFNFDDNALYRHGDLADMDDPYEKDPSEVEAEKSHLNYIKLDGNVGCMVNGAGLAMATMDIIKLKNGEPANFLDIGGGATVETVENGFKIILMDKKVKAVLINIFGGIVRCDRVAQGIINAVKNLQLAVPVVVRLAGTNADLAKEIFEKSDVPIVSVLHLEEAAVKVVELVKKN